ncbi:hypothetical protein BDF14DRAFT_1755353 [Spinellus fusiger]|nr:hypothetical protein BDF14DRAFT_1755353 [Spinellus fusiger]
MPFINELKEAFALNSDIKARQESIHHSAIKNSPDGYYYQGLLLLQKLGDGLETKDQAQSSNETPDTMISEILELLASYKAYIKSTGASEMDDTQYKSLLTRYYLLSYPVNKTASSKYIQESMGLDDCLDLPEDPALFTESTKKQYPSSLSQEKIDAKHVVVCMLEESTNNDKVLMFGPLAVPLLISLMKEECLVPFHKKVIINTFMQYPQTQYSLGGKGMDISELLVEMWQGQEKTFFKNNMDNMILQNLTLHQMEKIQQQVPDVVYSNQFVTDYLDRLVPLEYEHHEATSILDFAWGEGENRMEAYLSRVWEYLKSLPDEYQPMKACVLFYQLRLDIIRHCYSEERLLHYLMLTRIRREEATMSPIPGHRRLENDNKITTTLQIKVPYLNSYEELTKGDSEMLEEYLVGLFTTQPDTSLEPLKEYFDHKNYLKSLYATVRLTHPPYQVSASTWTSELSFSALEALTKKSTLRFSPSTVYQNKKYSAHSLIHLSVQLKHVDFLTIRVYPMDLYHYWRLHPFEKTLHISKQDSMCLDGLCPLWERTLDYSHVPILHSWNDVFIFGRDNLASECMQGRGAWVIDFMSGRLQCRAIVQKGNLHHLIQDTSAGHLIQILDENNQSLKSKGQVWYADAYYKPDERGNILIPYRKEDTKTGRLLLLSEDGFCEPVSFTHRHEEYTLTAQFYIQSESISTGKKTEVVVVPQLSIHGQPASLNLLEDISLTVETTDIVNVKNSSVQYYANILPDVSLKNGIIVPDRLSRIEIKLCAKVKSTLGHDGKGCDVHVNYNTSYCPNEKALAQVYLRIKEGSYYLLSLGKNGDPWKHQTYTVRLKHTFLHESINVTMQTDDEGVIQLGSLESISSITVTDDISMYEQWNLLEESDAVLPYTIHSAAQQPIKVPFVINKNRLCSLYQVGMYSKLLRDYSDQLVEKDGCLEIAGLPEGHYIIYLSSFRKPTHQIHCWIINTGISGLAECGSHWSEWLLGKALLGSSSRWLIHNPLRVIDVYITQEDIKVQIGGFNSSTYALITTTAFVESSTSFTTEMLSRYMIDPERFQTSISAPSIFMNGKSISEEYQYILERAGAEKWLGSTLTKPSLLMYPQKSSEAISSYHESEKEHDFEATPLSLNAMSKRVNYATPYCARMPLVSSRKNFGFLDQHYSLLRVIPNDKGEIIIDRSDLGDGNILQIVIFSGHQVVSKEMVLEDVNTDLCLKDLRQNTEQSDVEQAYVRTKSISLLYPSHHPIDPQEKCLKSGTETYATLELEHGQHDWKVIDSFEKVFDLFKAVADPQVTKTLELFGFLSQWPSFTLEKKVNLHSTHSCHELNFWLMKKDTDFYILHIQPFIKSKIQKSFMDHYLAGDNLEHYARHLHLYNSLSVPEKALLAKSIPDYLPAILRSFEDIHTLVPDATQDKHFDIIMAGNNNLNQEPQAVGFGLSGVNMAENRTASFMKMRTQKPFFSKSADTSQVIDSVRIMEDNDDIDITEEEDTEEHSNVQDSNDHERDLEEEALRQRAMKQQKKSSYKCVETTSEWFEREYYSDSENPPARVNQFWIDYLKSSGSVFLSGNFLSASGSFTQAIFALALINLPFHTHSQWSYEERYGSKTASIVSLTPSIVFHRRLQTCSLPPTNPTILVGQGLFIKQAQYNDSDTVEMIEFSKLRTATEYAWHLSVSNISSEPCVCEATLQIPFGAVPTRDTLYCQSKTILVSPYSTWRSVMGSFYFPQAGKFAHLPIAIANNTTLLNQTSHAVLLVSSEDSYSLEDTHLSRIPWGVVASTMKQEQVLQYLDEQKNLSALNYALMTWRMSDKNFARKVFDLLGHQKMFYCRPLWQYSLLHDFTDEIKVLIHMEGKYTLLNEVGKAFKSPLLCAAQSESNTLKILDYYPLINARAHLLRSRREILNTKFYHQYNAFLDYLCDKKDASVHDLTVLAIYLLLQDRIGECHTVYKRILSLVSQKTSEDGSESIVQLDYLGVYLQVRMHSDTTKDDLQTLDLSSIREITHKYRDCSNIRWRTLFNDLEDFIDEVDKTVTSRSLVDMTPERQKDRSLRTEPVLDMEVNLSHQLVIRYANMTEIQVRYYITNIEVVFSSNPFLTDVPRNSGRHLDYGWIKPNESESHPLEASEVCVLEASEEDDFEMIGVSSIKTKTKTILLPEHLVCKNLMIEVAGHGLRRCQTHFAHQLMVHVSEAFGVVRVAKSSTKHPIRGAYIKVYCRLQGDSTAIFWKDGYTGLNGVFDYVSVTQGNALLGSQPNNTNPVTPSSILQKLDKFSMLILSEEDGSVVKEAFPPFC